MDRKNGSDPLAPPRPPKIFPRVHLTRSVGSPIMSAHTSVVEHDQEREPQSTVRANSVNSIHRGSNNNLVSGEKRTLIDNRISKSHINNNSYPGPASTRPPIIAPLIPLQLQQNQRSLRNISPSTRFRIQTPLTPIISPSSAAVNTIQHIDPLISPVTLATPRPENERLCNEYVDTPLRSPTQLHHLSRNQHPAGQSSHGSNASQHSLQRTPRNASQHVHQTQTQLQNASGTSRSNSVSFSTIPNPCLFSNHNSTINIFQTSNRTGPSSTALLLSDQTTREPDISRPIALQNTKTITKQPSLFQKDTRPPVLHEGLDLQHISPRYEEDSSLNSITCPECKKCRCEQCRTPKQLPSRWVCNKTCLCSAETVIDYASCLCCVKALFYHCTKDHETEFGEGDSISCADAPCSCLPYRWSARWGCLAAISSVLPCLLCYWPMRGFVTVCAKCYAQHSLHGCRCPSKDNPAVHISVPINLKSKDDFHNHNLKSESKVNSSTVVDRESRSITQSSDFPPEKRLLDITPEF